MFLIPHQLNFPFILHFVLRPHNPIHRTTSLDPTGGLGDMKKSNCSIASNPTPTYVKKVFDWIQIILIPHQLNFPFILHFVLQRIFQVGLTLTPLC